MAETFRNRRVNYWALLILIQLVLIFLRILPLGSAIGRWPGPDWMLAIMLCWVLRRQDYVPMLLVAAIALVGDLVYMRPPGLWAALTVLVVEFLRSRVLISRDLPFLLEWGMVAGALLAMTLVNRLVLTILMVDQAQLWMDFVQFAATVLFYPLVAVFSGYVIGLTKVAPGQVDQLGHRI